MMWLILMIAAQAVSATHSGGVAVQAFSTPDLDPAMAGVRHSLMFTMDKHSLVADTMSGQYAKGWIWHSFYPHQVSVKWNNPPTTNGVGGAGEALFFARWRGQEDGYIYWKDRQLYCSKGDGSKAVVVPACFEDLQGDFDVVQKARSGREIALITKGVFTLKVEEFSAGSGASAQPQWGIHMALCKKGSEPLFTVFVKGVLSCRRPASQYLKHFFPQSIGALTLKGEPQFSYDAEKLYYQMKCTSGADEVKVLLVRSATTKRLIEVLYKVKKAHFILRTVASAFNICCDVDGWRDNRSLSCVPHPEDPRSAAQLVVMRHSQGKVISQEVILSDFSSAGACMVWDKQWHCPAIANKFKQAVLFFLLKDFVALIYAEASKPKEMLGFFPLFGQSDIQRSLRAAGVPLTIFKMMAEKYCWGPASQ